MDIDLPDSLKDYIDEQVTKRGYGTSSEYVRGLLLEGAASPPSAPVDSDYFESLRRRARNAGD